MNFKKEFKYFSIFDVEKEQEYLRAKHNCGWRFVGISGFGKYHFEKCEPEDVIYQLDYNKDGIAHKSEYVQLFADCGWKYVEDYMGYSYFSKPACECLDDEGIFNDEDSQQRMVEGVIHNRKLKILLPVAAIFFFLFLLPQFLNSWIRHSYETTFGLLMGLFIVAAVSFGKRYWEFRSRLK